MQQRDSGPQRLRVYRQSNDLWLSIQRQVRQANWRGASYLSDQITRAAHSIPSNIAEGHSRGSNADFIRFLRIAKGSATELKHHLRGAISLGVLAGDEAKGLLNQADFVERMLSKLIKYRRSLDAGRRKPKA